MNTRNNENDLLEVEEDGISIIDLLIPIAKHKKIVIATPIVFGIVAVGISLLLPNYYKASTRLLPPSQSQSTASAMLSQLGGLAGAAGGAALGLKNPNDLYIGMLKSRSLLDQIVNKHDLKKVYELDSQEKARKELENNTVASSGKEGIITIEVEDKDRARAVKLANAYVEELTQLTTRVAVTEAGQRRLFYEKQLSLAKDRLANAEAALKRALDTTGVVSVDGQSQGMVATIERLRASISSKEIQLQSMQAFLTPSNPEFQRVQQELSSMRAQLSKLESGNPSAGSQGEVTKGAGLENIKAVRNVKYEQMLYELLAKQYEVAKLDEAKDTSIIQVLDPAVEPEFKSKPKRSIIVVLAAFLGLFSSLVYIFIKESLGKERSEEDAAKWSTFRQYMGWR